MADKIFFRTERYKHAHINTCYNRTTSSDEVEVVLSECYIKRGFKSIKAAKCFITRLELEKPVSVIIDVKTSSVKRLIKRLQEMEWAFDVENGGVYCNHIMYSQVLLEAFKTAESVENWLYNHCPNIEYVGAVEKDS